MRNWLSYKKALWRHAWAETSSVYGGVGKMIIAQVIVIPVAVIVAIALNEQGGIRGEIYGAIVALMPILGMLLVTRFLAPFKIYQSQRERLELKEYDDIHIAEYSSQETIEEQIGRIRDSVKKPRLEVKVWNEGNEDLLNCCFRIAEIKYISGVYNNPPPPYETKPLKWLAGYDTDEGKIDLTSRGLPIPLRIAVADVSPISMFMFVYSDGISQSFGFVTGRYVLTIQLEGKVEKDGKRETIIPIPFAITFDFNVGDNNPLLNIIKIEKLPRVIDQ